MSAHTPGPWKSHRFRDESGYWISPEGQDNMIAATSFSATEEANARLMAAAPEMLSLLEEIEDRVNKAYDYALRARSGDYDSEFAHIHKLLANSTVIAKSKGAAK